MNECSRLLMGTGGTLISGLYWTHPCHPPALAILTALPSAAGWLDEQHFHNLHSVLMWSTVRRLLVVSDFMTLRRQNWIFTIGKRPDHFPCNSSSLEFQNLKKFSRILWNDPNFFPRDNKLPKHPMDCSFSKTILCQHLRQSGKQNKQVKPEPHTLLELNANKS